MNYHSELGRHDLTVLHGGVLDGHHTFVARGKPSLTFETAHAVHLYARDPWLDRPHIVGYRWIEAVAFDGGEGRRAQWAEGGTTSQKTTRHYDRAEP